MHGRYPIPAAVRRVEQSIKRSRFIATAAHAPDADAARAFIDAVRAEFPDATHNCWAYAAGPPGDTAAVGLSDDGEPHGTAGKPMLAALLHGPVGEIAVVVTRYFGGVKLGTGGLVRAYTQLVNAALETLETREKIDLATLVTVLPYPAVTPFKRLLPDFEAAIISETYAESAAFTVELPEEHAEAFAERLAEITDGKAMVAATGE
ncbi:YigZ family protein [Pseudodesulfovibrio sp.]|uniref:YigZ family protein n=1 Tax=Pseudodesulfovibrio sp. TaxID=2035812 RepID=UPI0026156507|nr:YigZ family protein [Pseudodesulfovibrio sp.]MDD3310552.1 YigZ family protein [Pseudodesulfovibrio sp.]